VREPVGLRLARLRVRSAPAPHTADDAREKALQEHVRAKRARGAREHHVARALEELLDVAKLAADALVREDREIERVVIA
jgi:hypothetical protein